MECIYIVVVIIGFLCSVFLPLVLFVVLQNDHDVSKDDGTAV